MKKGCSRSLIFPGFILLGYGLYVAVIFIGKLISWAPFYIKSVLLPVLKCTLIPVILLYAAVGVTAGAALPVYNAFYHLSFSLRKKMVKENTIGGYFFTSTCRNYVEGMKEIGRGNWDFSKLYVGAFKQNLQEERGLSRILLAIYHSFLVLTLCLAGIALMIIIGSFYGVFIIMSSALVYMLLSAVWLIEKRYRRVKRIAIICPHCYYRTVQPHYLCPKCGTIHENLMPGSRGIFKHTCICGTKLPVTFFNGRRKLPVVCPKCGKQTSIGESTPIAIAVLGNISSCKTRLIATTIEQLRDKVAAEKRWEVEVLQPIETNEKDCKRQCNIIPYSRQDAGLEVYILKLASKLWRPEKLVYLYDPLGSDFSCSQRLKTHVYYEYCDGFIWVIDSMQDSVSRNGTGDITSSAEDLLDTFVLYLENQLGIRPDQVIDKPFAVAIPKSQDFNLEYWHEDEALKDLRQQPRKASIEEKRIGLKQKALLKSLGMLHIVNKLECKFTNVNFFLCNLKGQENAAEKGEIEAIEPLLWILKQQDKKLRKK